MTTTTRRRSFRAALAVTTLPLLVAGLAACSAGGTDAEQSTDSVQKQARTWDTTLAECMRDAGYEFADPDSEGTSIDAGQDEGWFTQFDTCLQSTTDELGERPVSEAEKKANEEADAKFTEVEECLQEHGIDFPRADEGTGPVFKAPEVPDDVAETCGWDDYVTPAGE